MKAFMSAKERELFKDALLDLRGSLPRAHSPYEIAKSQVINSVIDLLVAGSGIQIPEVEK